MADLAWARVFQNGQHKGAAVLLTGRYAVSAAHCVKSVAVCSWEQGLTVQLSDRQHTGARVIEIAEASDLALIELYEPLGSVMTLPTAKRCVRGDPWFAPARPTLSDPELEGKVAKLLLYTCYAGATIAA